MNKIAIILSHCNSEEKKRVLKTTIEKLKNIVGLDILLTSHIPLGEDIIESVDYFVYDKSNPKFTWPVRAFEHYRTFDHQGILYLLSYYLDDYGYTPFNQMLIGYSAVRNKKYDIVYYINYDTEIGEKEIETILSNENETKIFKVKDTYNNVSDYSMIFSKFKKSDINKFVDLIDPNVYIRFSHAEKYFEHLVQNFEIVKSDHETTDCIDFGDGTNGKLFNHSTDSRYKIFYADFNQETYEKMSKYFIYDVNEDIELKLNNTSHLIRKGETKIIDTEDTIYIKKDGNFQELTMEITTPIQSIIKYEDRKHRW